MTPHTIKGSYELKNSLDDHLNEKRNKRKKEINQTSFKKRSFESGQKNEHLQVHYSDNDVSYFVREKKDRNMKDCDRNTKCLCPYINERTNVEPYKETYNETHNKPYKQLHNEPYKETYNGVVIPAKKYVNEESKINNSEVMEIYGGIALKEREKPKNKEVEKSTINTDEIYPEVYPARLETKKKKKKKCADDSNKVLDWVQRILDLSKKKYMRGNDIKEIQGQQNVDCPIEKNNENIFNEHVETVEKNTDYRTYDKSEREKDEKEKDEKEKDERKKDEREKDEREKDEREKDEKKKIDTEIVNTTNQQVQGSSSSASQETAINKHFQNVINFYNRYKGNEGNQKYAFRYCHFCSQNIFQCKNILDDEAAQDQMFQCTGSCHRIFHKTCVRFTKQRDKYICFLCKHNYDLCSFCKEIIKIGSIRCNFYDTCRVALHKNCLEQLSVRTIWLRKLYRDKNKKANTNTSTNTSADTDIKMDTKKNIKTNPEVHIDMNMNTVRTEGTSSRASTNTYIDMNMNIYTNKHSGANSRASTNANLDMVLNSADENLLRGSSEIMKKNSSIISFKNNNDTISLPMEKEENTKLQLIPVEEHLMSLNNTDKNTISTVCNSNECNTTAKVNNIQVENIMQNENITKGENIKQKVNNGTLQCYTCPMHQCNICRKQFNSTHKTGIREEERKKENTFRCLKCSKCFHYECLNINEHLILSFKQNIVVCVMHVKPYKMTFSQYIKNMQKREPEKKDLHALKSIHNFVKMTVAKTNSAYNSHSHFGTSENNSATFPFMTNPQNVTPEDNNEK